MKRTSTHEAVSLSHPKPTKIVKQTTQTETTLPCDTEAGLLYLQALFPCEKMGGTLPPIVLKHQIYSIIKNKTTVDREIISLRNSGKIRLIKLESASDDYAVISHDHYCTLICNILKRNVPLQHKVINTLLPGCVDVSISKIQLTQDMKFTSEEISELVKHGLLLVRDVGKISSWWFTIPGISLFKTDFTKGRASIIQIFKRMKHKEILQKDLETKKLAVSRLPVEYHIHDLIGAELVESVDTSSSGPLLKLLQQ